jgi:hypothetical protein
MTLNFAYELDDVGTIEILGRDGSTCRVTVATARPDDPRGYATAELHFSIPGLRSHARAIQASDITYLIFDAPESADDEYMTLTRMAIDMLPDTHPLAGVRDAARAKRVADAVLASLT